MDEINRVLGNKGAPIPLVSLGQTWNLTGLTQLVKTQFGKEMKLSALKEAYDVKNDDPIGYRELMNAIADRAAMKEYAWGSMLCGNAVTTLGGATILLRLLLTTHHPDITDEMAQRIFEDNPEGVNMAVQEIINSDPNS